VRPRRLDRSRRGARRGPERERLDADARLFCLFAGRMPRQEGAVGLDVRHPLGVAPVAQLRQLRDACARLRHQLAVGVLVNEARPGLAGIGAFR